MRIDPNILNLDNYQLTLFAGISCVTLIPANGDSSYTGATVHRGSHPGCIARANEVTYVRVLIVPVLAYCAIYIH